jgi:hypothetical protein
MKSILLQELKYKYFNFCDNLCYVSYLLLLKIIYGVTFY